METLPLGPPSALDASRAAAQRLLQGFERPMTALTFGTTGGIGAAFHRALEGQDGVESVAAGRTAPDTGGPFFPVDLQAPETMGALAEIGSLPPLRLVLVASGLLHDAADMTPEKKLADLDADALSRAFAVNAAGPLLLLQHLEPLLPRRGRVVVAALSARVGSIEDNRLGGWYSYRCSKAALNQGLRCAAIELKRTRRESLCVALHPGTVDTPLSQPFQAGLPAGQLRGTDAAATSMLDVLSGLEPEDSGRFFAWDGERLPW